MDKDTYPGKLPYIILGLLVITILVIMWDLWEIIKTKLVEKGYLAKKPLSADKKIVKHDYVVMKDKQNSDLNFKYPQLCMISLIVTTIDAKNYFESLILPYFTWWFSKAIVETAILCHILYLFLLPGY